MSSTRWFHRASNYPIQPIDGVKHNGRQKPLNLTPLSVWSGFGQCQHQLKQLHWPPHSVGLEYNCVDAAGGHQLQHNLDDHLSTKTSPHVVVETHQERGRSHRDQSQVDQRSARHGPQPLSARFVQESTIQETLMLPQIRQQMWQV